MIDTEIKVKLDHFDGPLGLLLVLIQKEEMDVRSLDITSITKQYLEYLMTMEKLNFDVAGEYLYMAATLVLLKSHSCVTEDDVKNIIGEDVQGDVIATRSELIRRLELLQHYQHLGQKLWALPKKGHEVHVRPKINRQSLFNTLLLPMEVDELTLAMMDFLQKERKKYKVVKRDRLSIKEKLVFLKEYLEKDLELTLNELTIKDEEGRKRAGERTNLVITFISLLELARLKKLSVYQNEAYGEIYVRVKDGLKDFDVEMADGFEEEGTTPPPESEETQEQVAHGI